MKFKFFSVPLAILVLFTSGCASFQKGVPQEVVVLSFPSEASVYINGIPMGITPLVLDLPRKVTHEVRLSKYGYNSAVKYFTPEANEKSRNFIRFGLSEDLGYYVDLTPGAMKAKLQSGIMPESISADPFGLMAKKALEADALLETGEITPLEHKAIIEEIIEFFEENI